MTLKVAVTALVDSMGGDTPIALSSLVTLTNTGNPAYLVVNALDRNEYTVTSNGDLGYLSGNGAALGLASIGGDASSAGIVFTWQPSDDQYVNATYGALSQVNYVDSASPGDVTNLSFFETSNAGLARLEAGNAYGLMQTDASGYLGSTTIATNSDFSAPPPATATPDGVAAVALAMVGKAWNEDGCWLLASTIAGEAGAGLPVQSTALGIPGAPNGEWFVLYNGPVASTSTWANLVSTGDVVAFMTSSTSGHITTCVSGVGSTAQLVDNITYIGQGGSIQNSANDGSSSDIIISPPHPASQEFAGINAKSVVIYALDTPAITDRVGTETLTTGATVSLATLFSAADPAHKGITAYQVYNTAGSDTLLVSGKAVSTSASAPATATSLAALSLDAGSIATADMLEIRAYNGSYWGDWQSLAVNVAVPPPKPPVLGSPIGTLTWLQGSNVTYVLPAKLFKDPQGAPLGYTVSGPGGAGLPSWLSFNPGSNGFSGTVPAGMEKLPLVVTATDALGAFASTTFTVNVPAAAPVLATQEAAATLVEGSVFSFALPAGSFADPQGENLTFRAALSNGGALPIWLRFSAANGAFAGTAPKTASNLQVKITATDTSGLSASEVFAVSVAPGDTGGFSLADWNATGSAAPEVIAAVNAEWGVLHESPLAALALNSLMQVGHV